MKAHFLPVEDVRLKKRLMSSWGYPRRARERSPMRKLSSPLAIQLKTFQNVRHLCLRARANLNSKTDELNDFNASRAYINNSNKRDSIEKASMVVKYEFFVEVLLLSYNSNCLRNSRD